MSLVVGSEYGVGAVVSTLRICSKVNNFAANSYLSCEMLELFGLIKS